MRLFRAATELLGSESACRQPSSADTSWIPRIDVHLNKSGVLKDSSPAQLTNGSLLDVLAAASKQQRCCYRAGHLAWTFTTLQSISMLTSAPLQIEFQGAKGEIYPHVSRI